MVRLKASVYLTHTLTLTLRNDKSAARRNNAMASYMIQVYDESESCVLTYCDIANMREHYRCLEGNRVGEGYIGE